MRGNKANGNKAVFAIIMAISVLGLALVLPVSAVNENVIVGITSDSGAAPGATVTVPIIVYDVTDLGAGTLRVTYDSSVCNVTDVTVGGLSTVTKNINTPGFVRISAFDPNNGHTGAVTFANLKIKATGSYAETSPLNITVDVLGTYGPPPKTIPDADISVSNGRFTILSEPIPTSLPSPMEDSDSDDISDFVPTLTPTPPGFEAIFTIAGLLAVAYLVLRRKNKGEENEK